MGKKQEGNARKRRAPTPAASPPSRPPLLSTRPLCLSKICFFLLAIIALFFILKYSSPHSLAFPSSCSSSSSPSLPPPPFPPARIALCCEPPTTAQQGLVPPPSHAAIVTTVRHPPPGSLLQWLCYHTRLGFEHIFVFLDDPTEESTAIIVTSFDPARVTLVRNDQHLLRAVRERNSTVYARYGPFGPAEVMARQLINADYAAHLLRKMYTPTNAFHAKKIDWLLHIDVDELFYVGPSFSIVSHFAKLKKQGFMSAVYLNYEAVAEQAESNFFQDTTLFKRNRITLPNLKLEQEYANDYMVYHQGYWTGKSAARLDAPELTPLEVTRFWIGPQPNSDKRANCDGPVILHYINPTLSETRKKYELLGKFSDTAFDPKTRLSGMEPERSDQPKASRRLPWHNTLKHIVQTGALPAEYSRFGMLNKASQTSWVSLGVLVRVRGAADLISAQDQCLQGENEELALQHLSSSLLSSSEEGHSNKPSKQTNKDELVQHAFKRKSHSRCPEFKNSENITCFAAVSCCEMLSRSRGALKTPPYIY
eukprot:gb/GEZN01006116.1/.p1 GENE.gb/GEZN01006116.1/~~gb/GEZN01006116.1/.p1  ORF type:complete len:550 (+),score=80.92 gb/GEZN01006116.1/:40-1650(+)